MDDELKRTQERLEQLAEALRRLLTKLGKITSDDKPTDNDLVDIANGYATPPPEPEPERPTHQC